MKNKLIAQIKIEVVEVCRNRNLMRTGLLARNAKGTSRLSFLKSKVDSREGGYTYGLMFPGNYVLDKSKNIQVLRTLSNNHLCVHRLKTHFSFRDSIKRTARAKSFTRRQARNTASQISGSGIISSSCKSCIAIKQQRNKHNHNKKFEQFCANVLIHNVLIYLFVNRNHRYLDR